MEEEVLYCFDADVETFNACVGSFERNSCQRYRLVMGAPGFYSLWGVNDPESSILINGWNHIAASVDEISGDGCALLPESVQSLELSRCHKMKRWEWLTTLLPNLKEIIIYSCEKLEEMMPGPLPSGATCCLTYLEVNGCNNMERVLYQKKKNNMERVLLTQDVLLHLPFLQEISVKDCKGTVPKMTHCSFPKLMKLGLWNLSELKSISDGTTSCDSLQRISIDNYPKLKRIPPRLPLLDNGLLSPPPSLREIQINRQMWESLDWNHPLARSSLEPFVEFLGKSPTNFTSPFIRSISPGPF
ncbi:uncharacterized protein J3R85_002189 [Psidium guajava]|nr:uncharacterized protein J3R85_002189 [Psidium guajava]